MGQNLWLLLVLFSTFKIARLQNTAKPFLRNPGARPPTAEDDHYALLRSRFNQYFSSTLPQSVRNLTVVEVGPSAGGSDTSAEANSTQLTTRADPVVASTNIFVESPVNYFTKPAGGKEGRRQKYPVYVKASYKVKSFPELSQKQSAGQVTEKTRDRRLQEEHSSEETEYGKRKPYRVAYAVKSKEVNNYFNREESSDGKRVTGQYRVLLPDGRIQTVIYAADRENGYNAVVTYKGTPKDEGSDEEPEVQPPRPIHSTQASKSTSSAPLQMGGSSLSPKIMYGTGYIPDSTPTVHPPVSPDSIKTEPSIVSTTTPSSLPSYYQKSDQQPSRYAGRYVGPFVRHAFRATPRRATQSPSGFQPSPSSDVSGFVPSYFGSVLYGMTPAVVPTDASRPRPIMPEITPVIPMQPGKLTVLMTPLPTLSLAPAPPAAHARGLNHHFGRSPILYQSIGRDRLIVRCSHFNQAPWSPIGAPSNGSRPSSLDPVLAHNSNNGSDSSVAATTPSFQQQGFNNNEIPRENLTAQASASITIKETATQPENIAESSEEVTNYELMSSARDIPLTFGSDMEEMEHFMNYHLSKMEPAQQQQSDSQSNRGTSVRTSRKLPPGVGPEETPFFSRNYK